MRSLSRLYSLSRFLSVLIIAGLLFGVSASALNVKEGRKALPIEAKDAKRKTLSLKQYAGKLVLVDFWATWCPPCRAETPNMLKLHKKYNKEGFEIIGIAEDEDGADVMEYVDKKQIPWRLVLDNAENGGKIANLYGVYGFPTMILIGPDGKVIDTLARGRRLQALVEKHIKSVTNKKPIVIPEDVKKETDSK